MCRSLPVRQGQRAHYKEEDDQTVEVQVGEEIGDDIGKADQAQVNEGWGV